MIDPIPGWSWDLRASGVILTSDAGHIRYVERAQPARRIADIVQATQPAGWASTQPFAVERLLTREHEYAALAICDGMLGDVPTRRAVGVVWLDDWYALIDGVALGEPRFAALAATVRDLTWSDTHMRGVRRRRYQYRPPAGWTGLLVPPHTAYWLAPDYPRGGIYAVAFPAQPGYAFPAGASAFVAAVRGLSGDRQEIARSKELVSNPHGLSGSEIEADVLGLAVPTTRVFVVVEDQRYLYPFVVEAPSVRLAEVRPVLRALADSIEPLPGSGRSAVAQLWTD